MSLSQLLEGPASIIDSADATPAAVRRRPVWQALAAAWRLWRERTAARRALATVDARTLRDIGIPPELVDYELAQASWRPLLDWHAVRYVHGVNPWERRHRSRPGSADDQVRRRTDI